MLVIGGGSTNMIEVDRETGLWEIGLLDTRLVLLLIVGCSVKPVAEKVEMLMMSGSYSAALVPLHGDDTEYGFGVVATAVVYELVLYLLA